MRNAIKAALALAGILLGAYLSLYFLGWAVSGFLPDGSVAEEVPLAVTGLVVAGMVVCATLLLALPFMSLYSHFCEKERKL